VDRLEKLLLVFQAATVIGVLLWWVFMVWVIVKVLQHFGVI
jgi:hypothetical protein